MGFRRPGVVDPSRQVASITRSRLHHHGIVSFSQRVNVPVGLPTLKASATLPYKWWGHREMTKGGDDEEKASGSTPLVFIGYASQDAAVAAALVETLERKGIPCWIAPRDVKAGTLYADAIVRAISRAKSHNG